jgi:lysozyme family protein
VIASLAGRRIDAADADLRRFPQMLEDLVAKRIAAALTERAVTTLVCAAACGADLLALEAAQREGIEARIVLPFDAAMFRRSSVTDRGEEWGAAFDRVIGQAQSNGAVRILGLDVGDPHAYEKTNEAILDEALALAGGDPAGVIALAVWDGPAAGRADLTANFAAAARARGIAVQSIPILQ